ncbi:MAG: extracellular solute-binding protein [Chloroflexota bacterium]
MHRLWLMVPALVALAGCDAFSPAGNAQQSTPTPSPTSTPEVAATLIPTVEATPDEPESLVIWLPDVLIPAVAGEDNIDLLNQQIAEFGASMDVTIEIRRKRVRDVGGILPTLRTAKDIAPGVIPDVTLVQREDLLAAADLEVAYPVEGIVPSGIIGDLYESALRLGQVDGELFGVPYALEIQHVVYDDSVTNLRDSSFETYLEADVPFTFPAARATGLNNTFLVQYLAAGGTLGPNGELQVNEEALLQTLRFYEEGVDADLITSQVLDYTRALEYRSVLTTDDAFGAAVVSSQVYMELLDSDAAFGVGALPTASGDQTTSLDGWMWVMTTADSDQQSIVADFIDWMLDVNRQGEYVRSLALLPSQRGAFRAWYGEAYDEAFINTLLENAQLPLIETTGGTAPRAIQTALEGVIAGEQTAREATAAVVEQMNN